MAAKKRRGDEGEVDNQCGENGNDTADSDGDEHTDREKQCSAEAKYQCYPGNQDCMTSEHHHALHTFESLEQEGGRFELVRKHE